MAKRRPPRVPPMTKEVDPSKAQQQIQLPPKRTLYENGSIFVSRFNDSEGNERFELNFIPAPGIEMLTLAFDRDGRDTLVKMLSGGIEIAKPGDLARL